MGEVVSAVEPSPKSQKYEAMEPKATVEAETSKRVGRPASAVVTDTSEPGRRFELLTCALRVRCSTG